MSAAVPEHARIIVEVDPASLSVLIAGIGGIAGVGFVRAIAPDGTELLRHGEGVGSTFAHGRVAYMGDEQVPVITRDCMLAAAEEVGLGSRTVGPYFNRFGRALDVGDWHEYGYYTPSKEGLREAFVGIRAHRALELSSRMPELIEAGLMTRPAAQFFTQYCNRLYTTHVSTPE